MTDNDKILNMACSLASAIQLDERYTRMIQCRDECDRDAALQLLFEQYGRAKSELEQEISAGQDDEKILAQLNAQVERSYEMIAGSQKITDYQQANDQLSQLVRSIQMIIAAAVRGEDPSAVQESCCTTDCCGCKGCNT